MMWGEGGRELGFWRRGFEVAGWVGMRVLEPWRLNTCLEGEGRWTEEISNLTLPPTLVVAGLYSKC